METYFIPEMIVNGLVDRLKYIKHEFGYVHEFIDENILVNELVEYEIVKQQRVVIIPDTNLPIKKIGSDVYTSQFAIEATVLSDDSMSNWITANKLLVDLKEAILMNHFLIIFENGLSEPSVGDYVQGVDSLEMGMISAYNTDGLWDGNATGNLYIRRLMHAFQNGENLNIINGVNNFCSIIKMFKTQNINYPNPENGEVNLYDYVDKINFIEGKQIPIADSDEIVQVSLTITCEFEITNYNFYAVK